MIIIYGDTTCLNLEENFERFFETLGWCQNHKCILKKNKVTLRITTCGVIVERDSELDLDLELCDIYDFVAQCKTCMKKASCYYED